MYVYLTISQTILVHYVLSMLITSQSIQMLMRFKNCLKLGWLIQNTPSFYSQPNVS